MKRFWPYCCLFLMNACPLVTTAELTFEFNFAAEQVTFEELNGYSQANLVGADLADQEPGTPWLPVKWVNILLPAGASNIDLEFHAHDLDLCSNIVLYPAQPPAPLSEKPPDFAPPNPSIYSQNLPFPALKVEKGEIHQLREHTILSIKLNPLTYRPGTGALSLSTNLIVVVQYTAPQQVAAADSTRSSLFSEIVSGLVINPSPTTSQPLQLTDSRAAAVDYLIITPTILSNAFRALANHRRTFNGLTTQILTTEHINSAYSGSRPDGGTDLQTKIRNCISNHVARYGTTYVVLGGENTLVPDRNCYVACGSYTESAMPVDLYYSGLNSTWDENANGMYGEANYSGTLDEGDLAFDVIVGRIPVATFADATKYIGKVIHHDLVASPALFSQKLMLCGDQLWNGYTGDSRPSDILGDGYSEFRAHSPVSDDEIWCRRLYRDGILAYDTTNSLAFFFDTLSTWDESTPGSYIQSSAHVASKLDQGWNHVYFATHGSASSWGLEGGSFDASAAAALTNVTAFVYTMACLTGGFDLAEPCLSEAFLRNPQGGALVYMGCSRYGWGSPGSYNGGTSMSYAYEFYKQIFLNRRPHIGQAFAEHKLARIAYCGGNGSDRWVQFGLNLQGDPLVATTTRDPVLGNDPFWFRAVARTNSVWLRWPDPMTCGVPHRLVQVRYRPDGYPSNLTDGALVYSGENRFFEHTGRTSGQPHYYTIWVSHDGTTFIPPP